MSSGFKIITTLKACPRCCKEKPLKAYFDPSTSATTDSKNSPGPEKLHSEFSRWNVGIDFYLQ